MTRKVDFIVVGSGFAGSIMAMILRRLGKNVVILEKDKHPRFAIGESSTPLANLLIEEIARKYDLPDLTALSKWGTWQASHPEIACGLKRGFTFYKHEFGREIDFSDRSQQLLVAASPHDRIADTHWYRPDFDAYLAHYAETLGADLFQGAQIRRVQGGVESADATWRLEGKSSRGPFEIEAHFLVDATGPRGFLFRHFGSAESRDGFAAEFPETSALFAHFRNVERMDVNAPALPYPVDDAAVHHVFEGGWIWVLRFNNGITSAGAAVTRKLSNEIRLSEGATGWHRLLDRLPSVRAQFSKATPITDFIVQPRLAFRSPRAAGPNWVMLPSAVGFVDPLYSTGFALTLLGIERLSRIFEAGVTEKALARYEEATFRELDQTGFLIANAYKTFSNFPQFTHVSRLYFVAAVWSETLRRLGRKAPEFLLADDSVFSSALQDLNLHGMERDRIANHYDLAGLCDVSRENWHPAKAEDLFANAIKIPATRAEIAAMLKRCGF